MKFKQEWFEILNHYNAQIRDAVIAAVTVYFYTGEEPVFSDDVASVAFAFIRLEIDRARQRRQKRLEGRFPDSTTNAQPENPKVPEAELDVVVDYWNKSMEGKTIAQIEKIPPESQTHVTSLLREHGIDAVRTVIDTTAMSRHFNGDNPRRKSVSFQWVFFPENFLRILNHPLRASA